MQMIYALPPMRITVHDDTVTALVDAQFLRQALSCQQHFTQQTLIFNRGFVEGADVLIWHNQHVRRRSRVDVLECCDLVILIQDLSGHFMPNDS